MLENILDIARMEAGNLKPHMDPIDAGKFAAAAFDGFKVLFAEKKIKFRLERPAEPGLGFKGDERLLKRVLENILSNAMKFTPSGGTVAMGFKAEKGSVAFYVSDTGPGIPGDQRAAVFEKYKQLGTAGGESQGFGLGLAISKKIVELHKGTIRAEAGSSGGSTFVFALPA